MKTKLLVTVIATFFISMQAQAAVTKLICTRTKALYGAKPEIFKILPFKVSPGAPLSANGEFDLSADTKVKVSSFEDSNEEIQTEFFISTGQTSFQVVFINKQREQLTHILLNNEDIIACEAVN